MSLKHFVFNSALGMERVEAANAVIHGVSIITCGVQAVGHELHVDGTTLDQMLSCAVAKGKVPVKYNHQSGVENVGGYLFNFRKKDNKLLADWQLMKAHKETPATLEKAQTMPECFGLSAAFMGKEAEKDGKKFARCTQLLAVDCVAQPAANPDGLFEAGKAGEKRHNVPGSVDTRTAGIMSESADSQIQNEQAPAWFTTALNAALAPVIERIGGLESFQNAAQQQAILNQLDELSDEQIASITAEDLAEIGWTAEDFTAYCEQRGEGGDPDADANADANAAAHGQQQQAQGAPANAAVASLNAKLDRVIQLDAQRRASEKRQLEAAEEQEFSDALAELQAKQAALVELNTRQSETIKSLELAAKTGGVKPSVETPNLFSAKEKAGEFETLVTTEFNRLIKAGGITELAAKAKALEGCIHRHQHAYHEWRARGGAPIQLGA